MSSPVPLDPLWENTQQRRLWIGNLDPRITEFILLKLLQQHGAIEKFDLLYHRSGPLEGKPKGYAFVTYSTSSSANAAIEKLHGKPCGSKTLCVKWAYSITKDNPQKQKPTITIPALAGTKTRRRISKSSAIQAIEAKLKSMEKTSPVCDFESFDTPSTSKVDIFNPECSNELSLKKRK